MAEEKRRGITVRTRDGGSVFVMTKPAKMSAYQKMFSMQRPRVLAEHPDATQPQLLQIAPDDGPI